MTLNFRKATKEDVPFIVEMMANDMLGKERETYTTPLPESYINAFKKISEDPNQQLIVVENSEKGIVGTFQLTFIPYLLYRGGLRMLVEAVRVREDMTGKGIGTRMFHWAIENARKKGVHMVQLTTDKKRPDAKRFYESLGFTASHEGMKLHLK